MKKIYLYTGKGAYQAKDLENFFAVFDFDYERICEHDLLVLKSDDIFIVPGGQVEEYLSTWTSDDRRIVRDFVKQGGVYIGICAGVYVAGSSFEGIDGLGLVDEIFDYQERQDFLKVENREGDSFELILENGPDMSIEGDIILSDHSGKAQALEIKLGAGKVSLFAAHPEGSVYYEKYPDKFSGAKFFSKFLSSIMEESS